MDDRRRPKGAKALGLKDDLEEARDGNIWKQLCGVHKAMEDHPAHADVIFDFCTNRHDKAGSALARTFAVHDIKLAAQTIVRHRKDVCSCRERMPERYDVGN